MAEAIRQEARRSLLKAWLEWLKEHNWRVLFAFGLLTVVLTVPVYYHRIFDFSTPGDTDYQAHIMFTQQMLQGKPLDPAVMSHPAIQIVLAAMYYITGRLLSLRALLLALQVAVQVITAAILYAWFGRSDRKGWDALRAAAAVTLTFVAPVMLLAPVDRLYYLG